MRLIFVLLFGLIGCSDTKNNTPKVTGSGKSPFQDLKSEKKVWTVDFGNKKEVVVLTSFGNKECKVHFNSTVKIQDDGSYLYIWDINCEGNKKCFVRWEILDHVMMKMPYLFEIDSKKSFTITHKTKHPPVNVYRVATGFEKQDVKGGFDDVFKKCEISASSDDFWYAAQSTVITIVPNNLIIDKDLK